MGFDCQLGGILFSDARDKTVGRNRRQHADRLTQQLWLVVLWESQILISQLSVSINDERNGPLAVWLYLFLID